MRSYRHAQYDQRAWDAMVDRVSADQADARLPRRCCFNDVRPVEQRVAPSAIEADPGPADIEWLPGVEHFNCDFCFVVTRQSGTLAVGLAADVPVPARGGW